MEDLKHLWKKYNASGVVDGRRPLSYRQFCRRYSQWLDSTKVTFHIQRFPGVNLEVDFAGKMLHIQDRHHPGQTTPVTIFVAALSYSDYFYIEGITCCNISNWIRVNNNALAYFGGVTTTARWLLRKIRTGSIPASIRIFRPGRSTTALSSCLPR